MNYLTAINNNGVNTIATTFDTFTATNSTATTANVTFLILTVLLLSLLLLLLSPLLLLMYFYSEWFAAFCGQCAWNLMFVLMPVLVYIDGFNLLLVSWKCFALIPMMFCVGSRYCWNSSSWETNK